MNKTTLFERVKILLKPHIKTVIIVTILSIIINIGEIIKPYLIKIVIDDYLSAGIYQKGIITIGIIGACYIGIVIFGNLLDFIASSTTNMMGEDILYSIRNKLFRFTQYVNIPFHDRTSSGKLYVRITNDVEDISTFFKDVITTILKDIVLVFVIIAIMITFSRQLSLMAFIVIPFAIIASFVITKIINKIYDYSKTIRTNLNTFLADSIYGIKLIKIFNRQREKQKECEDYTTKFRNSRLPGGFFEGLLPAIIDILQYISISIVIWACVNHWFGINMDVGLIYIFVTYIKQLFEPITRIIDNVETVQEAIVSINKIFDILDQKEYLEDFESGKEITNIKGKIEFRNVWFAYEGENWILKNVSFTINPGESIALVGKTGSGKTTITNLLNRFYEIQRGEIYIDDINIKDINLRSLREKIGIVLQEPFIFSRSIKDNIKLNDNIDDLDVEKAVELSCADEFVASLPHGLEQISREKGNSYSSGQKQLLAFARIFAHNPSIFILDEATANIDTQTEKSIQKAIDRISKDKTSIFIAHRLSTIVNVDKIIVLDHGEIIEQGNHHQLVSAGGYYSKLYNSYYESLG